MILTGTILDGLVILICFCWNHFSIYANCSAVLWSSDYHMLHLCTWRKEHGKQIKDISAGFTGLPQSGQQQQLSSDQSLYRSTDLRHPLHGFCVALCNTQARSFSLPYAQAQCAEYAKRGSVACCLVE